MHLLPDQIKRLTFRKNAYERYVIGDPGSVVKVGGKECGSITCNSRWGGNPEGDNLFRIRLQVGVTPVEGSTLTWNWVSLKKRFETDKEAREWLSGNGAAVNSRLAFLLGELKGRKVGTTEQTYTGTLWVEED